MTNVLELKVKEFGKSFVKLRRTHTLASHWLMSPLVPTGSLALAKLAVTISTVVLGWL